MKMQNFKEIITIMPVSSSHSKFCFTFTVCDLKKKKKVKCDVKQIYKFRFFFSKFLKCPVQLFFVLFLLHSSRERTSYGSTPKNKSLTYEKNNNCD